VENQKEELFLSQVEPYSKRTEVVPRNSYVPLSFFPYEPFEEFNSVEFRRRLEELLTEHDFDIVHFEWTQMALYSDLAPHTVKLLTEIEVNYAAHRTTMAIETSLFRRTRQFYNTLQTLYRELEICRRVDHVICVTDEDRGYLTRYLPSRNLSVVNTGVDIDQFRYVPEAVRPKSLLFVGAFRHSPNIDAMLYFCEQIFPEILRAEPETKLYIVGSSPTKDVVRLGEHPSITVTGFVEDIYEYYRLAQVVIVPLRTGVGIRGKILEAWAVGKATVATPLACQGISASHGENIMVAGSAEEFSKWTISLLRDLESCRKLGAAGRRTVEKSYDWNVIGEKMIGKYESLADS
jgi:glycosyltransferase involved in cell wall biosynthesis